MMYGDHAVKTVASQVLTVPHTHMHRWDRWVWVSGVGRKVLPRLISVFAYTNTMSKCFSFIAYVISYTNIGVK